jgi:hypothetical protein
VLETILGRLLSWIPTPWSGVRLRHTMDARLCTYAHGLMITEGPREPLGPLHVDVSFSLWVPEHRTAVREIKAFAAKQQLEANVGIQGGFRRPTLEPGAKPVEQHVALGPPKGEGLKARPGDRVTLEFSLTRGRRRKFKAIIEPQSAVVQNVRCDCMFKGGVWWLKLHREESSVATFRCIVEDPLGSRSRHEFTEMGNPIINRFPTDFSLSERSDTKQPWGRYHVKWEVFAWSEGQEQTGAATCEFEWKPSH